MRNVYIYWTKGINLWPNSLWLDEKYSSLWPTLLRLVDTCIFITSLIGKERKVWICGINLKLSKIVFFLFFFVLNVCKYNCLFLFLIVFFSFNVYYGCFYWSHKTLFNGNLSVRGVSLCAMVTRLYCKSRMVTLIPRDWPTFFPFRKNLASFVTGAFVQDVTGNL